MDIRKKPKMQSRSDRRRERAGNRIWIFGYLVLAGSALTVWLLLKLHFFHVFGDYLAVLQKLALGTFVATAVLAIIKWIERLVVRRTKVAYTRYNLTKMIRLFSWLIVMAIGISFLFDNWYSAAVSLGLISLILGFALQNPISSLIGWIYILIRQPYHVGDRIQIDTFRGDVVEVNYLDTTLWEFSGDYLTNDLPSGRLIRFPNSLILQAPVFNYSWEKFPYIWNEIPFHVAYDSDLSFVEATIKKIAKAELGDVTAENIARFKELLEQTPVDELEIREYPFVSYRINVNTWVEVMLTYLVEPKRAAVIRSNLITKILSPSRASSRAPSRPCGA